MGKKRGDLAGLPTGEQPVMERMSVGPVVADTFAGRIHVEWDNSATVTPLGQLPFFIEFLKQGSLFDGWVADCPLHYTSPNAPAKRDVLGTVVLSVLAGRWRYAHMTTLRPGQSTPVGHDAGGERGCGAPRLRQDRRAGGVGLAARPSRLHHAPASERTVDSRYRHHGKAALRPPGRGRSELQSEQAGAAVAQLSLLHDGQSAPGAGSGGCTRQPAYVQAFVAPLVGVVGWSCRRTAAVANPWRCRLRQ